MPTNTVNIGFLAHGPASANSLKPLIDILKLNPSNNVFTYAYHDYVSELWAVPKMCTSEGYSLKLKEMDIIVYDTGSANPIELGVAEFCKNHNIISISILDLFWSEDDELSLRFQTKPDYLLLPTTCALEQAERVIGKGTNLVVTGNPHFDRLQKQVRNRILLPPFNASFFSQCTDTSDYSLTKDDSLDALMELVKYRNNSDNMIKEIFVSPHPRENPYILKGICEEHNLIYTEESSTDLLYRTDFAYGHNCTLQYEAMLIGKPVSFYGSECLTTTIERYSNSYTEPKLNTVNATAKCLYIIASIIDNLILNKGEVNNEINRLVT